MNRTIYGTPMDEVSIEFIRETCGSNDVPVVAACSFGKDSTVLLDLVRRSGVAFEAVYRNTTNDPPELIWFGRRHQPEVRIERPPLSMWQLIERKGLPTRSRRFCCAHLKETSGTGKVLTGVRWEESFRRRQRAPIERPRRGPHGTIGATLIHPIYNWLVEDVWQYIRERHLPYCSLYNEGFHRIGCVICPMTTRANAALHAARWPKYFDAARRAWNRRWARGGVRADVQERFGSADAFWDWWMARNEPYPKMGTCDDLFI